MKYGCKKWSDLRHDWAKVEQQVTDPKLARISDGLPTVLAGRRSSRNAV